MIPTQGDIAALEGRLVSAVVYDSDISVDSDQDFASLKGATLGLTAFQVTSAGPNPSGPELPSITVDLLPSNDVQTACATIAQ